jgi:RNA polymerase sigma-70 factor (ECF subfamily)
MERYYTGAYHYLLGALRNEDEALDLFQEFAVRFLRGDFRRADPERGRFRDYLKKALINLANDHKRRRAKGPLPLTADVAAPSTGAEDDAAFVASWRSTLLDRAWEALAKAQPVSHAALLHRSQDPDLPARDLAQELTRRFDREFTVGNIRVILHRARALFADLLREEVKNSLDNPSAEDVRQELRALRLEKYYDD